MVSFSERFKDALYIRRMKQVDIAKATGINAGLITHYFRGVCEPKTDKVYLIAKALNVSPVWLLGYDVPMTSPSESPEAYSMDSQKNELHKLVDSLSLEECAIATRLIKSVIKGE